MATFESQSLTSILITSVCIYVTYNDESIKIVMEMPSIAGQLIKFI